MAHYAAILTILDSVKRDTLRPRHLEFLNNLQEHGKIFAKGPFVDGTGGLIIYIAESLQDAQMMVEQDPYVAEKALHLELREWKIL